MSSNITKFSILVAMTLWSNHLIAGSVTVPNTFVSGTAASASEVNANFSAIKTEVDDNNSRITTNADDISANAANITANTNTITALGGFFSVFVNGSKVGPVPRDPDRFDLFVTVLLSSDYLARMHLNGDGIWGGNDLFYASADCKGQAYADNSWLDAYVIFGQGQVFNLSAFVASEYYYVPIGTPNESLIYNSRYSVETCTSESATITTVSKAYPNDPNVTGYTGGDFIGTVTVGR